MKKTVTKKTTQTPAPVVDYSGLVGGISELLESARRASARAVNSMMTAVYWETGRRIVEFEQGGEKRAVYGEELLVRLADDLTKRFGRGFSRFNLGRFRQFYLTTPPDQIRATLSLKSPENQKRATVSLESKRTDFAIAEVAKVFPLPWSHYVLLISRSRSPEACAEVGPFFGCTVEENCRMNFLQN